MSPSKVNSVDFISFSNVVDGKLRSSDTSHQGVDPCTGEKLWDVPVATQQDVDDAVAAGNKAFESWSQTPLEKRKELLMKYNDLLASYDDEMMKLLKAETGKPPGGIGLQFEIEAVHAFFGYFNGTEMPEERIEYNETTFITHYTPLGVVGAICPWNFPLVLAFGKIIPAVVTGNVIIVKPSPFTPYTILKAIELAQQVFPPGVIQALGGDDKLGPMMTAHPGIAKISFTGSIATGKRIMAACAKTLKRVTLELGGNDAAIVLPDVDVDKVAPELVEGAMQNSGQVCVATKRIYIHESIYEKTVAAMAKYAATLTVGAPDDENVRLGPVQNKMQYDRVKTFFEDSEAKGYKFIAGSAVVENGKGFFVRPAIIDNPPNDSRIIAEEPFGPIVPTQPWSDEAEVIRRANDTNTGLGACVWAKDVKHAETIARKINSGTVWINSWEKPTPMAHFSGHKESGIGGEWGSSGWKHYCNVQAMHIYN